MKTIGTFLFTALITLMAGSVFAGGNLKVNFATEKEEFTAIEISNVKSSLFKVEIIDSYGTKIYSFKTDAPASVLKKKYNFSNLQDGLYSYKVEIDGETAVSDLEIKDGEVNVMKVRKTIDPVFIQKDQMLKLTHMNPQMEEVKLYIYDSSNMLLTSKKLGSDFAIHKAVDTSELERGNYELVLADNVDFHVHKFTIK